MPANDPQLPWPRIRQVLHSGGVIAYPTEAVFGLGCDPDDPTAVARLLSIKRRDWRKGLILIAATRDQLAPYLACLAAEDEAQLAQTWPGPQTWLVPAAPCTPDWLTGDRPTLAVRVTAHPIAAALCRRFGKPLVSTSANRGGQPPLRSALDVRLRPIGREVDLIVPGRVGDAPNPTPIRDLATGAVIRAG